MKATRTRIAERDITGVQTEIGKGALGTVYRLESHSETGIPGLVAYKKFHQPLTDPLAIAPIEDLIGFRLDLTGSDRAVLDGSFAWPLKLVVDTADQCLGLLIPMAGLQYFIHPVVSGEQQDKRLANLDLLFDTNPDLTSVPLPHPDDLTARLQFCLSLSKAFTVLHADGFVYGDFSQRNGVYTLTPTPNVFLIDCDEIRRESDASRQQSNTPSWRAPGATLQTRSTDIYKVSLFILRCLVLGGPDKANKVKAHLAAGVLNAAGMDLLERGLGSDPDRRPTAADWSRYLANLLIERTSPPTIKSLTISDDLFPIGEPVSVRWDLAGAEGEFYLRWPDGYVETFSAESDPAASVRPATSPGFVTLTAQNKFGPTSRNTPVMRVFTFPVIEKLSVPGLEGGSFQFPVPPDLGRELVQPDQQLLGLFTGAGPTHLPDFHRLTGEPADLRTLPIWDAPIMPNYTDERPMPPIFEPFQSMEIFRVPSLPSLDLMVPNLPRPGSKKRSGRFRTLLQRLRAEELSIQTNNMDAVHAASTEGFTEQ